MHQRQPVGILGLGLMGRPVAASVARAGMPVLAWNRSRVQPDEGVTLVESVAELIRGGKRLRPAFCYWGWRAAGGT